MADLKTGKMTRDFALGYYTAMERCIQFGRDLEGDCGNIESSIINDDDYHEAESICFGSCKPRPSGGTWERPTPPKPRARKK